MRASLLLVSVAALAAARAAAPPPFEVDVALVQTDPAAAHAAWAAHYGAATPAAGAVDAWTANAARWAAAAAARGEATVKLNGLAALSRSALLAGLAAQPADGDGAATLAAYPYPFQDGDVGCHHRRPNRRHNKKPAPPPEVDWRAAGVMGPVKNQHRDGIACGCCWAFAATGIVEPIVAMASGQPAPSLSEQQLIDCDRGGKFKDKGCKGGSVEGAVAYIRANGGLDSETDYPYTGNHSRSTTACVARKAARHVASVGRYVKVPRRSEAALRAAVARHPVSVAVCCGDFIDDWHAYTGPGVMTFGGNRSDETGCARPLDHAVVVVGYKDDDEHFGPHWLVKNSWGEAWGDNGYFRLRAGVAARDGAAALLNLGGFPLPAKTKEAGVMVE